MKRRDFLTRSLALTGLYLPVLGRVHAAPCPPVLATAEGAPICGNGEAAEVDWQARIAQPGVVWYHDFRSDAEVDAFRWSGGAVGGNDPQDLGLSGACIHQTNDSVTGGGCLEITRPAGTGEPPSWWRPFSPLDTGSGKTVNDPGAGLITPGAWAPTQGGSQTANWATGYYGHEDHNTQDKFDGNDYYLQVRMKMDPRRISGGNEAFGTGKNIWTSLCKRSLTGQETVINSHGRYGNQGAENYFQLYAFGTMGLGPFDPLYQEDPSGRIQPGSESPDDWYWSGGWDTVLIHQRPGRAGQSDSDSDNCELFEAWAAHEGETEYTKIYWQEFGRGGYEDAESTGTWGMQALLLSVYNNSRDMPQEFWHRYDQVIFSRDFIECPQV